jgi:hypothetical protein
MLIYSFFGFSGASFFDSSFFGFSGASFFDSSTLITPSYLQLI